MGTTATGSLVGEDRGGGGSSLHKNGQARKCMLNVHTSAKMVEQQTKASGQV
jgi:hypothetical protein